MTLNLAVADVVVVDGVREARFDEAYDTWEVTGRDGERHTARVVIDVERGQPDAYLGVARHGVPNYFTVTTKPQMRYVTACIRALADRECTRVEVKAHVHAQYSRGIRPQPDLRILQRRNMSDFEFNRIDDDDEDDDYQGPAVLVDDDCTEIEVQVHLAAVYEPLDNTLHWSGRIAPSDELRALHRTTNQPVRLRIDGNEPVDGLLLDADPWGGSHITGQGRCLYS